MRVIFLVLSAVIMFAQPMAAHAAKKEMVTVKSGRGVTQPFLLVTPDNPKAGVILFVGSTGELKLSSGGEIREQKNNFFSRTYEKFADQGLMVAMVDVPSDNKKGAMHRISKNHATDIMAVIKYMKKKADVPVWLVGTSMGSFSAASVGIKKQKLVSGMVLTSSVTRPEHEKELKKLTAKYPEGVAGLNLNKFKKPALIVAHEGDTCEVSPPADAAALRNKLKNSPRVQVVMMKGGSARKSGVCEGQSKHGFYGIESDAVKTISNFIKQ